MSIDVSSSITVMNKKVDQGMLVIFTNTAQNNQFAMAIVNKKAKKIEITLPLTREIHFVEIDGLNFEVGWCGDIYLKIMASHVLDKKKAIETLESILNFVVDDANAFANQLTHNWLWFYQQSIPKPCQFKQLEETKTNDNPLIAAMSQKM